MHTYHSVRRITSYGQFRQHLKTHLFRAKKSQRIVTLEYCALYKYSYLLTYLLASSGFGTQCSSRSSASGNKTTVKRLYCMLKTRISHFILHVEMDYRVSVANLRILFKSGYVTVSSTTTVRAQAPLPTALVARRRGVIESRLVVIRLILTTFPLFSSLSLP